MRRRISEFPDISALAIEKGGVGWGGVGWSGWEESEVGFCGYMVNKANRNPDLVLFTLPVMKLNLKCILCRVNV